MPERPGLAAVLVVILAGTLAADFAWARGRGGHAGGKRGGAAHATTASGGGARTAAAHGGAAATVGGARIAAVQGAGARGGGGRAGVAHAGGGLLTRGAFFHSGGRYFGHPPPRVGGLVGLAALWAVPPLGYPAPVVVVPYMAPEYIEMEPEQPAPAPPQGYWYYCPDESTYYPYVDDCPGGWELVAPPGGVPVG